MATAITCAMAGLVVGLVLGWYIGLLRGRAGSEGICASLGEVRGQLAARDAELAAIRQALDIEKVSAGEARARLESAREHFAEQRRQIEQMQDRVKETFAALSAAALKSNNEQFITLADAKMKPLGEQLERYEKQIKALEEARAKAYGGLDEKLTAVQQGADQLKSETSQLVAALRSPGAKGKWGEVTLQRVVELTGMTEHCDFSVQATQEGGGRPDLVVHLPGGRSLAIDSKVNAAAYLDAVNATTDDDRKRHMDRFNTAVRTTLKGLSAREYWKQFEPAPEFVVMFMPGEAFFSAALLHDPDLLVDAAKEGVVLASPTTLMALLMAVRHGWQQQQMAENAQLIAEAGRDLYERLCTFVEHLEGIRAGLEKAVAAYNSSVGNWQSRTLPGVRKLKELGAAEPGKEPGGLEPLEVPLRQLPPGESGSAGGRRAVG